VNSGDVTTGNFAAEHSYTGGAITAAVAAGSINTTNVDYAAPVAVYSKRRYGNFYYSFGGFAPNTAYTVRLHLMETFWSQAGKRVFNVNINNVTVVNGIDLYEVGGKNKAVVRDVTGVTDSSGNLLIDFVSVIDNASVCGIEVLGNKAPTEQVIGINSADTAFGGFAADNAYTGGAAAAAVPLGSINASGTVNAAPAAIYTKRRYGTNFSYTLSGLGDSASYTLRLHMVESYWNQAGKRIFHVKVNNTTVISNLDLFAAAGNKLNKVVVKDIPVVADSLGNVVVQFVAVKDNAAVAGLQLLQATGSNQNLQTEGLSVVKLYAEPVYPVLLKVSPNPVSGNIRFSISGLSSNDEQLQVTVTNTQGSEVYRTRITSSKGNAQHELQTGGRLLRGIYFLNVSGKNFRQTTRVVVL
jgi:hypothetical protein